MTQAAEIMTPDPITIAPRESLQRAAQLMDEFNVGALPVCENGQLLGIITDRDIAVRALAVGQDPTEARVGEVMSDKVHACSGKAEVEEVLTEMARVQIRRLMVLDRAQRLVGVIRHAPAQGGKAGLRFFQGQFDHLLHCLHKC